jgi:hypothetical protein
LSFSGLELPFNKAILLNGPVGGPPLLLSD